LSIDRIEHDDQILRYIIIPKSENAIAVRCEFGGALFVSRDLVGVLAAVQLDDESLLGTGEIGDAIADRMLAAELVVGKAVVEGAPEDFFYVG
jgi:hypothetical protein